MRTLLLINGVSGAGKTTTASLLHDSKKGSTWIHPDGLWANTPHMTSEQILSAALDHLLGSDAVDIAIIDCQIAGTVARQLVAHLPTTELVNVLLTCNREERERRARERCGNGYDFDRIDAWSRLLLDDAIEAGDLVIDTTARTPNHVALGILKTIRS